MKNNIKLLLIPLMLILVGAGCTITINKSSESDDAAGQQEVATEVTREENTTVPAPAPTPAPVETEPADTSANEAPAEEPKDSSPEPALGCGGFESALASCSPYRCKFIHPFTEELTERRIIGLVSGECKYEEDMPEGGLMTCNYNASERSAAAKYYADVNAADSTGTSVSTNGESTYTINGKEVENPLEEFLNDGTCLISGY